MEDADNRDKRLELPAAMTPPASVEESTEVVPLWRGQAELRQESRSQKGEASVFVDTLPRPIIRFEFQAASESGAASGIEQFRQWFEGGGLNDGELDCGSQLGKLAVHPTNSAVGKVSGTVGGWAAKPDEEFTSAKFLVINGPSARGNAITRGRAAFVGRLRCVTEGGMTVTIDGLSPEKQSARSVFGFTHVAEIRFDEPRPIDQFDDVAEILFKTLSLMRVRWVGLVGPWLYIDDALHTISAQVTKTTPNGSSTTWCHDAVLGVFEELFTCLQTAYQDRERGQSLQTGLHWLIESQQCAGGVEGSLILQQAALEALAWFVIVQDRKLCSADGFEKLPASDKIRWLTSLYLIPTVIPAHFAELVSYAKAYNLNEDLPVVLVDARNALIHGSPKKVERLFARHRGDDERTQLWYLIGGLLEQVVLAIAGYRGKILRRDTDAVLAVSAVKQVPWA